MKKIKYLLFVLPLLAGLVGCDKHGDPQGPVPVSEEQKAAIAMRGAWGSGFDVSLPFGTTTGVLDDLSLDFRIDDDYKPSSFSATGAKYFFDGEGGTWAWADGTHTLITLTNILPVTSIAVMDEGNTIRLTFSYTNDPGRIGGTGTYGVSLRKIAP